MAVNYLTLRSTLFYNTPGGASIPAGYINVASTSGVNTLWTNNAAFNNTTFSTLTGSTITSVSSIGIGTSNPGYNLDVAGPTRLQTLQQSDTNSALNARGFQNTGYSTVPVASSNTDMVCISYTGQYIAGINGSQVAVSNNYGTSFTNSSSITSPVLVKISGNGQYLLSINNSGSVYTVYKSSDYGVTWTSTGFSYTGTNQYTLYSRSACLSNDGQYQYFLIRYNGGTVLYRSSNSGVSFVTITQPSSSINEICCSSNGQNLVLVLLSGGVYRSSDYGSTWTIGTLGYNNGLLSGISCSSSGQYVMIAGYGKPQWSDNYGATFTSSTFLNDTPPSVDYWITAFSASSPYVILSKNSGSSYDYLYYSTDYGQTFTKFTVPATTYQSIAVSQSAQYIIGSGSTSYLLTNASLKSSLITTGNVGVGTAAPAANLHIYNSNASFTGGATVQIGDGAVDAGGTYGMLQLVRANNGADNKAHLSFIKNGLTVFGMGYYPGASQSVFGLVPSFGTMATNTGLWMTTGGNVGVGKTTPVSLLDVAGVATATQVNLSGITTGDAGLQSELTNILNLNLNFRGTTITANPGIALRLDGRTGVNLFQFLYRTAGSATGTELMGINTTGISVNGAIYASGDISAFSDQRYKQNIIRLDRSLDKILRLSGYSYTRDDYRPGEKQIGLLAQEVQTVLPEAVHYDSVNDKYSVNYSCLMAPVVESIKDLQDQIIEQGKTIQMLLDRLSPQ